MALNNLGVFYRAQGRYAEAETFFKRALAITEKSLGPDHPNVGVILNQLGLLYATQDRHAEAEPLYKRALAVQEMALRPDHPGLGITLSNLAALNRSAGDHKSALTYSRRASEVLIAHAEREATGAGQRQRAGLLEQRAGYFRRHVGDLAVAAREQIEPEPALGREAFEVAQRARQLTVAAALQQMAARFASGGARSRALCVSSRI